MSTMPAVSQNRVIGVAIVALALALSYWIWPADVLEAELGSLTVSTFLWIMASVVAVVLAIVIAVKLWP